MARIVGDARGYTFCLKQANGRYSQDFTITLPSVTTVIRETYAAPALQGWNYRQTRDSIAGLAAVSKGFDDENSLSLIEMIEDADILEEWLAVNRMRPEDIGREAMERGSQEHETLEQLAKAEDSMALARNLLANKNASGYAKGIADWWLSRQPGVLASESVVYALEPYGGFAGSLDLVYQGDMGQTTLTDLKTRGEGKVAYTSDEIQTGAYEIAWKAMGGRRIDRRTTLVAREDGTWDEYEASVPASTFLHLLAVYSLVKGA